MNRIVTAKNYSDYVMVAYFENFEIKSYEYIYTKETNKFKRLEEAIRTFTSKYDIKLFKLSFNMEEGEYLSVTKTFNKDELDENIKNIRYLFSDLISQDEIDDYVIDYQTFKNNNNTDLYVVASSKSIIEDYVEIAVNMNKRIDVLRPESASLGCILSAHDIKDTVVVDIGAKESIVRVYEKGKIKATSVCPEGAGETISYFRSNPSTKMLTIDFKKSVGKTAAGLIKTISFYDEKKVTKTKSGVILVGEGTMVRQIKSTIEEVCPHKVLSAKDYLKGKYAANDAGILFSMSGLLY